MLDLKTIAFAIAVFTPLSWAIAFMLDGIRKIRARVYLIFLMFAASITYMLVYAKTSELLEVFALFYPLHLGLSLLLFPLFYLYLDSLTCETKLSIKNFKKIYIHFIVPVLFFLIFFVFQKFLLNREEEVRFVGYLLDLNNEQNELFKTGKKFYYTGITFFGVSGIFYFVLSLLNIRNHYKKIQDVFPSNATKELKWLKTIFVFLLPLILFFVTIHLMESKIVNESPFLLTFSYMLFAVFFWFLGLHGFRQTEVYTPEIVTDHTDVIRKSVTRYEIDEFISKYKPHRRPLISIFDFCIFLQVDRKQLTEVIRKEYKMNFRNLINQHRIDDAIEMINESVQNNTELNLEEVGMKAGFDTYNTFQSVFKNKTGITPADYVKKIQ
jgi:AraC-like DNA-binding protein